MGLDVAYLCTKFHSRNGAHQNFNGLSDMTTPFSGMSCHPWASTCYTISLPTKFEVSITIHRVNMTGDTKCRNWGDLG